MNVLELIRLDMMIGLEYYGGLR